MDGTIYAVKFWNNQNAIEVYPEPQVSHSCFIVYSEEVQETFLPFFNLI